MTTIFRDPETKKPIGGFCSAYAKDLCSICGGPPDAFWVGHKHISICHQCAVEFLPALIADATRAYSDRIENWSYVEKRMQFVFWRASALSLMRHPIEDDEVTMEHFLTVTAKNGHPAENHE